MPLSINSAGTHLSLGVVKRRMTCLGRWMLKRLAKIRGEAAMWLLYLWIGSLPLLFVFLFFGLDRSPVFPVLGPLLAFTAIGFPLFLMVAVAWTSWRHYRTHGDKSALSVAVLFAAALAYVAYGAVNAFW